MNDEMKLRLLHAIFGATFSVPNRVANEQRGELNFRDQQTGILYNFKPMPTTKPLRALEGTVDGVHLRFVEQNPNTGTWCANIANMGVRCGWLFVNGKHGAFLMEQGGGVQILTDDGERGSIEKRAKQTLGIL